MCECVYDWVNEENVILLNKNSMEVFLWKNVKIF